MAAEFFVKHPRAIAHEDQHSNTKPPSFRHHNVEMKVLSFLFCWHHLETTDLLLRNVLVSYASVMTASKSKMLIFNFLPLCIINIFIYTKIYLFRYSPGSNLYASTRWNFQILRKSL